MRRMRMKLARRNIKWDDMHIGNIGKIKIGRHEIYYILDSGFISKIPDKESRKETM